MIQQLSLFDNQTKWLNINNEWLLNYLNQYFPDLRFKYNGFDIEQTRYKGVNLRLSVEITDNLDIWDNPILILLDVSKHRKTFEGQGLAVKYYNEPPQKFLTKIHDNL